MSTTKKPWIAAGIVFVVGIIAWYGFLGQRVHRHWEQALCQSPGCLHDLVTQPSPIPPLALVAVTVAILVAFAQSSLARAGWRLVLWLVFGTGLIALSYAAVMTLWTSPYVNLSDVWDPPPVESHYFDCRGSISLCWIPSFIGDAVFTGIPLGLIVLGGWMSIRLLLDALTNERNDD